MAYQPVFDSATLKERREREELSVFDAYHRCAKSVFLEDIQKGRSEKDVELLYDMLEYILKAGNIRFITPTMRRDDR